jgi:hypothetical protein
MTDIGYCVLGFLAVLAAAFAIIPIGIMLGFDWNGFAQGHFNPIVGEKSRTFQLYDESGAPSSVEHITFDMEDGTTRDYFMFDEEKAKKS